MLGLPKRKKEVSRNCARALVLAYHTQGRKMSAAKDSLVGTVREFLRDMPARNKWINTHAYKVYVRRCTNRQRFWIASVEVYKPGQGTFKNIILPACIEAARREGYVEIIIENVLSDRFADYFRKEGWRENTLPGASCFHKDL